MQTRLRAVHVVFANWCPHCVPTVVGPMKSAAEELGVPCVLHDIDTDDVTVADELVLKHGDWTPDYLIPQVFLEFEGGKYEHVLTGDPRGLAYTRHALEAFLGGSRFAELRSRGNPSPPESPNSAA